MKKKQKINKAVNYGEWLLLGLTALFLCALFVLRERPAPARGITVRTSSSRAPDALPAVPDAAPVSGETSAPPSDAAPDSPEPSDSVPDAAPVSDEPPAPVSNADSAAAPVSDSASVSGADAAAGRVNLNTADFAELCALPGIGESLARRIIDYREAHGDFSRPEDVMRVSGIGEGKFSAMQSLITV